MPTVTAALVYEGDSSRSMINTLAARSLVSGLILVGEAHNTDRSAIANLKTHNVSGDFFSGKVAAQILDSLTSDYLLIVFPGEQIEIGARAVERMIQVADDSAAGLVYSDFKDEAAGTLSDHALIDYQLGGIRDNFDFGSMVLISKRGADQAVTKHGRIDDKLRWAGWYDLRLKLAIGSLVLRIPEPLYTRVPRDQRASGERQFDYVDPRKRDYQGEMEHVVTEHLKRIDAYLTPEFETRPESDQRFPVRASIVIPVRNRERTIKDAVTSALSQVTSFEFNAIVVDNHSTDRTTDILHEIALSDSRLIHLKPARTDLGIGGCWNEAIYSDHCGEYAVQLDSDDLYSDQNTLAKIIAKFDEGNFAMVIGSYTIVDFDLKEIPPGLIDHREWTRENGRNNALRISGLGAPRAFYVPALRQIGFPNASYGEDYSVALRISRQYEIGRIYESIYYARRWEGNSDAALPLATANRYDAYKDHLRTVEILARQKMNRHELE